MAEAVPFVYSFLLQPFSREAIVGFAHLVRPT
jgi:hypothetical protein